MKTIDNSHIEREINNKDFYLELLPTYNNDRIKRHLFRQLANNMIYSYEKDITESIAIAANDEVSYFKRQAENVFQTFMGLFQPYCERVETKITWRGSKGQFVFFLELFSDEVIGITNPKRNLLAPYKYEFVSKFFEYDEETFPKKMFHVYRTNVRNYLRENVIKNPSDKLPSFDKMQQIACIINSVFGRNILLPKVISYKKPPTYDANH